MNTSNEGRNVKMFFRILKKDLKRKKVMNAILLCFILLATMFVASGISNVVSVMNGTDSYLDKAGIGDYVVISMGADSKASIDEILHEMESIRDYRIGCIRRKIQSERYARRRIGGKEFCYLPVHRGQPA